MAGGLILKACPRCGGDLFPDPEDDNTFCINCGYVQWPTRTLEASRADAAQLTAALARPRGRYARRQQSAPQCDTT